MASEVKAPSRAETARVQVWDGPLRLFHAGLLLAVTVAIVTGELGGDWMPVHGQAGLAVLGLVIFRIVWGFVGPAHARFRNFVPTPARLREHLQGRWRGLGHNPLGALSVLALLGLLGWQAGSGLFGNDEIAYTGPLFATVDEALASRLTHWHQRTANALFVLIGLHVLAIAFYRWVRRKDLVGPMLHGWKQVPPEEAPQAPEVRVRVTRLALALAVALASLTLVVRAGTPSDAPAASAEAAQDPAKASGAPAAASSPW